MGSIPIPTSSSGLRFQKADSDSHQPSPSRTHLENTLSLWECGFTGRITSSAKSGLDRRQRAEGRTVRHCSFPALLISPLPPSSASPWTQPWPPLPYPSKAALARARPRTSPPRSSAPPPPSSGRWRPRPAPPPRGGRSPSGPWRRPSREASRRKVRFLVVFTSPENIKEDLCFFAPKPFRAWVLLNAVVGMIKLALEAGKATPAPPVGPALGAKGVNIMAFCKEYNAKTAEKAGYIIPVEITVFDVSWILSLHPTMCLSEVRTLIVYVE